MDTHPLIFSLNSGKTWDYSDKTLDNFKGNNTEVSQQITKKKENIFDIGVKQITTPLCKSEQ